MHVGFSFRCVSLTDFQPEDLGVASASISLAENPIATRRIFFKNLNILVYLPVKEGLFMRAFRVEDGIDPERLVRASLAEIESYAREHGNLSRAVLVLSVHEFIDAQMENGAEPQRKAQPR
jgi:hypothetical protein